MKTFFPKLLLFTLLVMFSAYTAKSTCSASFTKTISGLSVTFINTSTTSGTVPSAVYYSWLFSDGTTSNLKNPVKTFATAGAKTAQLTIYDSSTSCYAFKTDSFALAASGSCNASFTMSVNRYTVTLNNTSLNTNGSSSGLSYNWYFSDGTSSTLKNPVKTFSTQGVKSLSLYISDTITGCFKSYLVDTLVIDTLSKCKAAYSITTCSLSAKIFNNSVSTNGYKAGLKYYWSFSDSMTSIMNDPSIIFASGGKKYVTLFITDSAKSCYSSKKDSFTVNTSSNKCTANFTYEKIATEIWFTNTSIDNFGNAHNFSNPLWDFGDGKFSTSQASPYNMYATGGIKVVKLSISDTIANCFASKIDTILVVPQFSCYVDFSKTISGPTVTFNNFSKNTSGIADGLSYYWNFGDGTSSTVINPVKTFSTAGMKTVTLTISDSAQHCLSSKKDSFTVSGNCVVAFTKVISGLSVAFNNTSINTTGTDAGLSYYWAFSDGTSSTIKNPVKTFVTAGIKTAQLTISDSAHGCVSSKIDTIVLSSCNASFTFPLIAPLTIRFVSTSTNSLGTTAGLSYHWVFSDSTTSTAPIVTKTFTTAGVQSAKLTISDSTGCTSTHTEGFMLTASSCTASFTKSISGLTVHFNSTSLNTNGTATGLSYHWNFGDGTSSTLKDPTKTYTSGGMKIVQLTISDSSQGCSSFKVDTITLASSSCHAAFVRSVNGLTVTLTNASLNTNGSAAGLAYLWTFGDGTSSTLKDPVHTYATAGTKSIHLTISDSTQGCSASATETVSVMPLCSASFALAVDTTMPFHFFILNTSIIRSTSTFFWNFGDGGTSTLMVPTHTYASFGKYYVCLTVADLICTSTFCDSIGMDSTGRLLKDGAFGFQTVDQTTVSTATGIAEASSKAPEYSIYPNPSVADVHIDFTLQTASPITFQISDITGKLVFTQTVNAPAGSNTEVIDMGNLKPSIYFLNINAPTGQKNYKLIKN